MVGKVPLKIWFADRHQLLANRALPRLKFKNAVDQQKRIAVGNDRHDLLDGQHTQLPSNLCVGIIAPQYTRKKPERLQTEPLVQ